MALLGLDRQRRFHWSCRHYLLKDLSGLPSDCFTMHTRLSSGPGAGQAEG